MALARANLVYELSSSTGTGNFSLLGLNGHQRFSDAFGTGVLTNIFDYFISNRDANEWERGTGHCSAAGVLVRDTVKEGSNGTSLVFFSAGTKDVTNDVPADQTIASLGWRVKRLRGGIHAADTTGLTLDLSAKQLSLYNPEDDTVIQVNSVPTGLTCNLATTGAGGRDTGSAPVYLENWRFYFIGGASVTVKLIASKTAPFDTNSGGYKGPVRPSGYTHYAPGPPVVISEFGNLLYDSHQTEEADSGTFSGYISGTTLHVSGSVTGFPLAIGSKVHLSTVLPGTLITAGSGVTWTVNKSQTVGSVGSPVSLAAYPVYPTGLYIVDDKVWYTNAALTYMNDFLPYGTYHAWDYSQWVPTDAVSVTINVDAEASTTDIADEFIGACVIQWSIGVPNTGNDVNFSVYSFGYQQPFPQISSYDFPPVAAGYLNVAVIDASSTDVSFGVVMFMRGYKYEL